MNEHSFRTSNKRELTVSKYGERGEMSLWNCAFLEPRQSNARNGQLTPIKHTLKWNYLFRLMRGEKISDKLGEEYLKKTIYRRIKWVEANMERRER